MRHRNATDQLSLRILAAVLAAACASWVAAPARRAAAAEPAAGAGTPAKSGPLRLMLLWTPQSQFAGYYVAEDRGLFRKRGLDVRILPGGPDRDPVARLEGGETDFAVLWLVSALVAEDRGFPLAHVCQVFQRPHLGIAAWKDRGVRTVADLQGRTISLWGEPYRPAFTAFLEKSGVTPKDIMPQYGTVSLFLLRAVDACSVMDYNEYQAIYLSGIDEEEIVLLRPGEGGVSFPEDGIYCARKTLRERPEACKALAEATIEGWTYAAEHPDEALDSVMRRVEEAKLASNRALMRRMLRQVLPSVVPAGGDSWRPGELRRESYEAAVRWMRDLEVIDEAPAFEALVGRDPGR